MNPKEIEEVNNNFQKGLYNGVTELILLSVVSRAGEPLYGYQIAKLIEKENTEIPIIKLGTLYPVLRSLEKTGFLESRVDPSVSGPPRRYYKITELGLITLAQLADTWDKTKLFVDNMLTGVNHD
jgi:PadR family transcriptional regulator, regulatory protein PadR